MNTLKIIIAEDVDIMRRLLQNALLCHDCEIVAEVENGNDIHAAVKEHHPDILFLDINMPGKNGLDVLQEIRTFDSELFIAMVSGYSSFENVKNALEYGANGFVVKPFTGIKIKEMLDKYHSVKSGDQSAGSVANDS